MTFDKKHPAKMIAFSSIKSGLALDQLMGQLRDAPRSVGFVSYEGPTDADAKALDLMMPLAPIDSLIHFKSIARLRGYGPKFGAFEAYDLEADLFERVRLNNYFKLLRNVNVGTLGHHDPRPSVLASAINKAVGGKPLVNQI